jgi:hypothetical protein
MIANDSGSVGGREIDETDVFAVSELLPGTRECGLEQRVIAKTLRSAMKRQEPIVEGEYVRLIEPDGLLHFASLFSVLR